MTGTWTICRRELTGYFASPLAYVFIIVFLVLAGALTFFAGGFFERAEADLRVFFQFHPWLYLILMPAIGMRLWAEEQKTGTFELLMTLPVTAAAAVVGKFIAAWLFTAAALALTFPVWLTVNYLGSPDNGVILVGYLGSWLMAGGFLVLASCASALTTNQVVAFVLGAVFGFLFLMSGVEVIQGLLRGWLPPLLLEAVASFSFLTAFDGFTQGVVEAPTVVLFASVIAIGLFVNVALVELRRDR